MLWCVAAYRKRRDDHQLPPIQTRYHMPLEIMYTAVPTIMILVLFFYTDRDMSAVQDTSAEPDVNIQVIGKQWSWDFNYLDSDVYDSGQHLLDVGGQTVDDEVDGAPPGTSKDVPTLYLPVDKTVEFTLDSRDVIHSFWIPAFLYKQDMIPGRTNTFQVTPRPVRARTPASAPSSAASSTPGCSSTSRSCRRRSTSPHGGPQGRGGRPASWGLDLNRQQHDANFPMEDTLPEVEN